MASDFASQFAVARDVLEEADDAFGGPLSRWIATGPDEVLRRTEVTQPAILAASLAIYRSLEPQLPAPAALLAGHSLGEYSALVVAGGLSLADAVRLVRRRGAFMQEAVPEGQGEMAAVVGLDAAEVARICASVPGQVAPANLNAPTQSVIAGSTSAVREACEALREAGAKRIIALSVSAPFHCELMAPARDKLSAALAETCIGDLHTPVVSNVTAEPYRTGREARDLLQRQVCAPVRWVDCIRRLVSAGTSLHLEVGPGRVLSGLSARIDRTLARANVSCVDDLKPALSALEAALA